MTSADFNSFFAEIHGVDAFPWQRRLVTDVLEGNGWPDAIGLPTAAGKTAVIDVAVFTLAAEVAAGRPRRTPRRIFFVVDRRIVVDQTHERAHALAERLAGARAGVVAEVAEALRRLGGDVPLSVSRMRGGMYLDRSWVRSPAQPVVCVSTVDQVGSRLLFRGYGLASHARNSLPVHAGLIGHDALIILDEAHLSQAFSETVAAVFRYRRWAERDPLLEAPWHVVEMTATPRDEAVFREDERDLADPVLRSRLRTAKPARLLPEVSARADTEDERRSRLADAVVEQVLAYQDRGAVVVGAVVNRVGTARAVFERLRQGGREAVLLIGPSRPHDRAAVLERYLPRIRAGRDRGSDHGPLAVVATQTVEVGADLDLDALVTECAALDSLCQRFGRLNRLGELGEAPAAILIRSDHAARTWKDPVYGAALAETWRWLKEEAGRDRTIDMSHAALAPRLEAASAIERLRTPAAPAPIMLPAHLDLLAQTSPIPVPDPDVAVFLHGVRDSAPDVQIVWRADLPPDDPASWLDIVSLLPPASPEALPVPVGAARGWLAQGLPTDPADVEGVEEPGDDETTRRGRTALRWRGPEESALVTARDLRPGDTIVVPSAYGGADEFGWHPASAVPVPDIAEAVALDYRRRAVLRLHPALPSGPVDLAAATASIESGDPSFDLERDVLVPFAASDDPRAEAARLLLADRRRRMTSYPDGTGVLLVASRGLPLDAVVPTGDSVTDEDDSGSFTRAQSLADHTRGVVEWTHRLAAASGVPRELAEDLALAAELHDLGKADPRFQLLLHGGDRVSAASADEPLAKSGLELRGAAYRRARERAAYPAGYRHEAASVALSAAAASALSRAHDPELVLHLIASHHGCARPFFPPVPDPEPVDVSSSVMGEEAAISSAHGLERLDSGVSDRFWTLLERYGWYGLAYLEAVLRLADWRQSEEEQRT